MAGPVQSLNRDAWRRSGHVLAALACMACGLWLAGVHPLAPALAVAAWLALAWIGWRWPDSWLVWVPAGVPLASLAPWTGWVAADEFDLLVLAVLAAGHARLAAAPVATATARSDWRWLVPALLWLSLLVGLLLAWRDVLQPPLHASGPYTGLVNAARVGKSLAYALLAAPLLRAALERSVVASQQRLAVGMLCGAAILSLGVLWERAAFPGLLNFGSNYRTVGLFWEMHVGGAAIDAYLAIAMPFALWAVVTARRTWAWLAAAVLLQVLAYVCLTTFARGVYGAVLGGLLVVALLRRWQPPAADLSTPGWRRHANAVLVVVLAVEVVLMAWASSFLSERLRETDNDFGSRVAHWGRGLSVVQTPLEQLAGIGLGRLPERYADAGAAGEFPGAAIVLADPDRPGEHFLRLHGAPTRPQLAGRFAWTQQIPLVPDSTYRVAFDLRAQQPTRMGVAVCERHLLYETNCQLRSLVRRAGLGQWQRVELDLAGLPLSAGPSWAPRRASLELVVLWPGTSVDIDNLGLMAGERALPLRNPGFETGTANWFPVVDAYFLPWHIDNLYLEWLIERGVLALGLFLALCGAAFCRVAFGAARGQLLAPFLAASLAGGCALGLVSSIMDMPRVAFLFLLLGLFALQLPAPPGRAT